MKVYLRTNGQQMELGRKRVILNPPVKEVQIIVTEPAELGMVNHYELWVLNTRCRMDRVQLENGQFSFIWEVEVEPWWGELDFHICCRGRQIWPSETGDQRIYVDAAAAAQHRRQLGCLQKTLPGFFPIPPGSCWQVRADIMEEAYQIWCLQQIFLSLGCEYELGLIAAQLPPKIQIDAQRAVRCNDPLQKPDEMSSCSIPLKGEIILEWRSPAGELNGIVFITRYHLAPAMLSECICRLHVYRDALIDHKGSRICRGAFLMTPRRQEMQSLMLTSYQIRYGLGILQMEPLESCGRSSLNYLVNCMVNGGYTGHLLQMRERLERELQQRFPYGGHLTLKGQGIHYQTFGREIHLGEEKIMEDGSVLFKVLAYAPAIDREFGGYVHPDRVERLDNGMRFNDYATGRLVPGTYVEITDLSEEQQRFLEPWSIYW